MLIWFCCRHALDTDSKKWRLFADFLNDAAMFLELLLLPMYPQFPTQILCLTTSMKGIVGVAAGASRASITQHHVNIHNLVDAIEQTQQPYFYPNFDFSNDWALILNSCWLINSYWYWIQLLLF